MFKVSQFIKFIFLGLKNQLNESKVGIPDSTGITGNTNLNNSKKNNRIYNL